MKTYSETRGQAPIDWNARLARDPETITSEEWAQWKCDALCWVTCACGNQCVIIPRKPYGAPEDKYLDELGCDFYLAIDMWDIERARTILKLIEARSAKIIAQITKDHGK